MPLKMQPGPQWDREPHQRPPTSRLSWNSLGCRVPGGAQRLADRSLQRCDLIQMRCGKAAEGGRSQEKSAGPCLASVVMTACTGVLGQEVWLHAFPARGHLLLSVSERNWKARRFWGCSEVPGANLLPGDRVPGQLLLGELGPVTQLCPAKYLLCNLKQVT